MVGNQAQILDPATEQVAKTFTFDACFWSGPPTVEHDAFADGNLGPPYEVSEEQVRALFGDAFEVRGASGQALTVQPASLSTAFG